MAEQKSLPLPNIEIPVATFPNLHMDKIWYKWAERVTTKFNIQDTGWTAATGVGSKGAYAVYAGHVCSAGYVQAEAQATDDAIKALSARVKALEDAVRLGRVID